MKYLKKFDYYNAELAYAEGAPAPAPSTKPAPTNNNADQLSSLFFEILVLIEQNISIDEANFDKDKLVKLLKYSDAKKGNSMLYVFTSTFIKNLITSIDSNNNALISELVPMDNIYITIRNKGREKSPYNYIRTVINLLDEKKVDSKINKLLNKYKQILRKSNFEERWGTRYYDPTDMDGWDYDDKTHDPIASNEDVIETLFKYYKPGFSLLDIGAGYGNIMRISEIIGYKVKGIELKNTKKYTKGLDIIYDDFFNVSSDIISEFDIIYFFRPLVGSADMDILLRKLDNDCKTGAIIIYNYPHPNLTSTKLEKRFKNFKHIETVCTDGGIIVFQKVLK